jgi:hypothetical protein
MGEKQELIKRMLEMQKKFIEFEHKQGVNGFDYYTPGSGHELDGYRQEYAELATKVVDIAHGEAGSHR